MNLALLDWMIILVFFGVTMFVGLWVAKNSEKNSEEYFLGSRKIPW